MQKKLNNRCGITRAACVAILAGLLAACADQSGGPAPVFMKGGSAIGAAAPSAPSRRAARQITVQPGQSVDKIAQANHVPPAAIIAANQLKPPYELKAGMRLIIPDAGPPQTQTASAPSLTPQRIAATPLPPPAAAQPAPLTPQATASPQALTPPATPQEPSKQPAAASPQPQPVTNKASPDVIPLDGPQPREAAAPPKSTVAEAPPPANGAPPVVAPRNAAAALPLPGEAPAGSVTGGSGRFPWPVQGRVLAGYGATANGARNDGINIAAARGTPVRSIDAGTVAYVGNEVKGYGNLVLVKHENGWISAYAHLDNPTVKVGDKVGGGQVIAKVGATGGVGQPQLHFELRRGKNPVDPREFLAPAPSAGSAPGNKAG